MTTAIWTLCFAAGIGYFIFQIWQRFQLLIKLRRDDDRDYSTKTWGNRLKNVLIYMFAQKKFFSGDQPAGWMHIIIFWGFVILALQVKTMFLRGWFPDFHFPGLSVEGIGGPYALIKDFFQIGVLVAVGIALFRWTLTKPQRLMGFSPAEDSHRQHSHGEAVLILIFIATIMVSGFFYDAGRLVSNAFSPEALAEASWQPITAYLAGLLQSNPWLAENLGGAGWWIHNLIILFFLNILPRSKHFHIITVLFNIFLGKVEPKGRLAKSNFEVENPLFGRSQPVHFTWKQALDMYSCTECGRCSSQCPATATGKPLAPRQFLLNLRDTLYENQAKIIAMKANGSKVEFDVVVGEGKPVSDDVIWSCVNCRACEEACPLNIEYIDKIDDIRQHLVQEVSRFPEELSRTFKGIGTQSNPWGINPDERTAWAKDLNVPTVQEKPDADYLFYVGCGGSFDGNARKGTQAFVKILQQANVSFAILGKDEPCCGETARRLGNEYLFQTMATALAELINATGIKKILINCPHGYNTLKNEYPPFGGVWEVEHAGAFVAKLVREGKIKPRQTAEKRIVYHDSCNFGRFNDIYEEPRELLRLSNGKSAIEMKACKNSATCCGAGGGAMWLEEDADKRVNIMRTNQALETNPEVIATSCPYCRIMFDSAINEKELKEKVKVADVMEIVQESL